MQFNCENWLFVFTFVITLFSTFNQKAGYFEHIFPKVLNTQGPWGDHFDILLIKVSSNISFFRILLLMYD